MDVTQLVHIKIKNELKVTFFESIITLKIQNVHIILMGTFSVSKLYYLLFYKMIIKEVIKT